MSIYRSFVALAATAVAALLILLFSLWSYVGANRAVSTAQAAVHSSYLLADQLRQSSDDLTRLVRTYVVTRDPRFKEQYFAVLDIRNGKAGQPQSSERIFWDFVAAGDAEPRPRGAPVSLKTQMQAAGFTDAEFALLDEAAGRSDGLVKLETEAMALVEKLDATDLDVKTASEMLNSTEYHRFKADIMKPIDAFYVALGDRLQATLGKAQSAQETALLILAGSLALAALAFALLIVTVFRRVVRRLARLKTAMVSIAGEALDTPVPGAGSHDEIGEMASSLLQFREAALAKRAAEAMMETERAERDRKLEDLRSDTEAQAAARLLQATTGIAHGLQELAAGNLSVRITTPFAPQFEPLRESLNAAIAQLATAMRQVTDAADVIDRGTREISRGADDLSKRTEQQAASLEETATALDQITANVVQAARRADEALGVAANANRQATASSGIVANAVEAIHRIEESSGKISSILSVIDEIAFQTNLLALNAGVEAARAGDAGKGFAVVAQEVRELAQRSAGAAKEIKALIEASANEVRHGVRHVNETGESLASIQQLIVEINRLMEAIASSADEQSAGLKQVNIAVNQMDGFTQQNAGMAEETFAAAAGLESEIAELRRLVSRFATGRSAAAPALRAAG